MSKDYWIKLILFQCERPDGQGGWSRLWISKCEWDVIGVMETWLRQGQDWRHIVPGYRYYKVDRGGDKRGSLMD